MEIRYQLRYRRPVVLGRDRAAAPPRGPAYTPAAPAGLFGSTTVAMPSRELFQPNFQEW